MLTAGVWRLLSPFKNDPFALVAMAFKSIYPERDYIAYVVPEVMDEEGNVVFGATTFPNDGSTPIVEISGDNTILRGIEIFAHELAHVATPEDQDHGEEWERAFNRIFEEYNRTAEQLFGKDGGA